MGRFLAGAVTAALLLLAGWLLWRGAAESDVATVAALPAPPCEYGWGAPARWWSRACPIAGTRSVCSPARFRT